MKVYKKYLFKFLLLFSFVLIVVFSINYLVDPYGNNNLFVEKQYKPIVNERGYKYSNIFYKQQYKLYDSYILGSSRVMHIVPIDTSTYNFGVHVANNAEKLFLLQELIKHRKNIKNIYLGIDEFNFNISMNQHFIDKTKFQDNNFNNYLSFSMLKFSLKSIKNKIMQHPISYFQNNGVLIYYDKEYKIRHHHYDFSTKKFQEEAKDYVKSLNNYILDEKSFNILIKIQELCKEHKINLYPFYTPRHDTLRIALEHDSDLYTIDMQIKQRLVSIFGKLYDFTIEDPLNKQNINFYDIVHYRNKIGNAIMTKFHSNNSYGKLLIKDSNAI